MALRTNTSAFTKAAAATCIAGAIAFGVLAGSMSASAAPADCATLGATTIAPGICQILVTTSGTFTAPAGVSHLEALLVSGGSVSTNGYSGGVGAGVMYVDSLPVDTELTFTIGDGATWAGAPATGTGYGTAGTGDGVEPQLTSTYGVAGVLPSAFVAGVNPASTLFPAYTGEAPLAGDGQDGGEFATTPPADTSQSAAGGGTSGAFASARANSGSGGSGAYLYDDVPAFTNPGDGGSGVIILRFAAPEVAALATTGTDSTAAASAAGVLLLGGAVALAATTAKRRRSARA